MFGRRPTGATFSTLKPRLSQSMSLLGLHMSWYDMGQQVNKSGSHEREATHCTEAGDSSSAVLANALRSASFLYDTTSLAWVLGVPSSYVQSEHTCLLAYLTDMTSHVHTWEVCECVVVFHLC